MYNTIIFNLKHCIYTYDVQVTSYIFWSMSNIYIYKTNIYIFNETKMERERSFILIYFTSDDVIY